MKTHFYATVNYVDGLHFKGKNPLGLGIDMDSRPEGEIPAGPAPMELILQVAGGCASMDVVFILNKRKIELEFFQAKLEGIKREEHPRIFREINLTFRAKAKGLTLNELEKAATLSFDKYCAVFGMLKETVPVNIKCELMD